MGIKRYFATADNTITNAFKSDLTIRATGSNMGAADILEIFSIYGQTSSSLGFSSEETRAIINFGISSISSSRDDGDIPASGSVEFYLKLYNAPHGQTLPIDYTIQIAALTKSWDEGYGLDMDEYKDPGTGSGGFGSTWVSASTGPWEAPGGDVTGDATYQYNYSVGLDGDTDVAINVSNLVEDWISGVATLSGSNGFIVRISPTDAARQKSYYTKKFFARESEFFFKRPVLEARWNSSIKDNGGNFCLSSTLATDAENLNTLYLYNYGRGAKRNIPNVGTGPILLSIYSGSSDNTAPSGAALPLPLGGDVVALGNTSATGAWVSTGVYSASFSFSSSSITTIFPVWHSGSTQYVTGCAIDVVDCFTGDCSDLYPIYFTKITNLQDSYQKTEKARFRLYTRPKNWYPTIYTVASTAIENTIIEDAYFKLERLADNLDVIPYGTGTMQYTLLSYDKDGNYFDLDMSMLQEDFSYGIKLAFKFDDKYIEQKDTFRFSIERETE